MSRSPFIPGQKPTRQQDLTNRRTVKDAVTFITDIDFVNSLVKRKTIRWEAGEWVVSSETGWQDP